MQDTFLLLDAIRKNPMKKRKKETPSVMIDGIRISVPKMHVFKTRHGKTMAYYPRNGMRLDIDNGRHIFDLSLAEARKKTVHINHNVDSFLTKYEKHIQDRIDLSHASKQNYIYDIKHIRRGWHDSPIDYFNSDSTLECLLEWRISVRDRVANDKKKRGGTHQDGACTADKAFETMLSFLSFASRRSGGLLKNRWWEIKQNLADVKKLHYPKNRSDIIWTQDHANQFLAVANKYIRWFFLLSLYTGQRKSDVLSMRWEQDCNEYIAVKPQKTRQLKKIKNEEESLFIPVTPELRHLLNEIPKVHDVILTNSKGQPWTSIHKLWGETMKKAGLENEGLVAHDIRGTFYTILRESGMSKDEMRYVQDNSTASKKYERRSYNLIKEAVNKNVKNVFNDFIVKPVVKPDKKKS